MMTEDGRVQVVSADQFWVDPLNDGDLALMNRQQLTEFRTSIDQALNTTADELYDGAVSRFPKTFSQLGNS